MAKVRALKAFQGTANEGFVHVDQDIEVDVTRHRALASNGLVPHPKGEEPATPAAREPGSITTGDRSERRTRLTGGKPKEG